jgi:hypothetical protein
VSLTNASSFRRMACGLCLLAGPALILVSSILDPAEDAGDDNRKYLQSLKDDPEMAQLSTALLIVGVALAAIGIIGLIHVIRRRGVVLANIGGALALIGMIFFVALAATTVNDINTAEHLDIETGDKLIDDVEDYWVAYVVFVPALAGFLFGFVLLGAAVIRSKLTHMAAGIMIIVGTLLVFFGEGSDAINILSNALLLGGYGMVGLRLLGMTDEQWDGRVPLEAGGPEAALAGGPPAGGPPAGGAPPAGGPPAGGPPAGGPPAGGPPAGGAGPTPPAAPPPNV